MLVTVTSADGLKRELKIEVPAAELQARMTGKLDKMKDQVRLKGFRPGKVPVSHLRKTFGKQVMGEAIQEAVNETSQRALEEHSMRPAIQPSINFEGEMEEVIEGKSDLTYTMSFEVIPAFDLTDFAKIKIERPVATPGDADVDEALNRLAANQKSFNDRAQGEKAESGDQLTIDFIGRIDGEAFEGGAAEDAALEIGSGQFIPGFEDQLIGTKVGDKLDVVVTFPADYGAENLAGKEAVFETTVKGVKAPGETKLDDEFAKRFGMEGIDKLREAMAEQMQSDFSNMSRQHLKRALLDQLDELHSFELPSAMVDQEFTQIWSQFEQELKQQDKTAADLDEPEDEIRAEYTKIAERRVRLGLVLAEVGEISKVTVTEQEVNQALMERARQFPGQERQVFDFYRQNPQAMSEIRAPIFEDKVIDYIAELATVTDKTVSRDELFAEDEHDHDHDHDHDHGEDGHVHGPDCDHDHDEAEADAAPAEKKAAPKKKPAAKKPAAKKAPAKAKKED